MIILRRWFWIGRSLLLIWFVGFMKQNSKDKDLSIKKLQLVKKSLMVTRLLVLISLESYCVLGLG